MTREEYLNELNKALKRIPKEERENAISYYREYFEDAGDEQEVIRELGEPKELARKILIECAEKNLDEENGKGKKNSWLVFLGMMALPISPMLVFVMAVLIFCVFLFIGCMIISGAGIAVSGVFMVITGICIIVTENALLSIGCGLTFVSLGVLIFTGFIKMWGWFQGVVAGWVKKIFAKKHMSENNLRDISELKDSADIDKDYVKKRKKLVVKIALCVLPVGIILFIIGYNVSDSRNFYVRFEDGKFKYGVTEYDEWKLDYTEIASFENIQLNVECGNISMKPAEGWGISYEVYGEEPSFEVSDDTLCVNFDGLKNSNTHFLFNMDFNFFAGKNEKNSEICIYYPKDVDLKNVNIVTEYGDISLDNLVCDGIYIKNECGDVDINSSDFKSSSVEMDYGDFYACKTNFGESDFKLECGDLKIEESRTCNMNIDAEYGDMNISLINPENLKYGYDIKTEFGDLKLNGEKYEDATNVVNINASDYVITVVSECGDVDISVK
jgi:uncharacterized membrane protein